MIVGLLLLVHTVPVLAPVFQDSMVLQRGSKVPVWGTAAPRQRVEVGFGGQKKAAVADTQGRWRIDLDPMPARAAGSELTLQGRPALRDVLVGEVWVAAGQSNMEWPLRASEHGAEELAQADRSGLRLFHRPFAGQFAYAKPFDAAILDRLTPEGYFSGSWQPSNRESAAPFSAVAYSFGRILHERLGVPVGVVSLAVGGSPAEAWLPRSAASRNTALRAMYQGDWLTNPALDDWCRQRGGENLGEAIRQGARVPADDLGPHHPFKPGFLYDAGVEPLAPMAFRGVIWYQGESNALSERRVEQHAKLFPTLVDAWRSRWGRRFPFLYCQLSSIGTEGGYQSNFWPDFRDQQRRFLARIPNVGMAVTSDVGHPTDVHPRNKRVVGERLARWALARTYGQPGAYSGPLPKTARLERGRVVVEFDHVHGGLAASEGSLRGFEVAGPDGEFRAANATLKGRTVVLSCPEATDPRRVRYGWRPFTDANLMNGEGLPASTFLMEVGRPRPTSFAPGRVGRE